MRKPLIGAICSLALHVAAANAQPISHDAPGAQRPDSELSYTSYVHSNKRIKCLYGYAANKTGDHAAAIEIFEDCIRRWDDVFSMIGMAQLYDTGIGIEQDFAKSTALMQRAAQIHNGTSYPSLARYHYGVALAEGHGIKQDIAEGRKWLNKAAAEGVKEAAQYLDDLDAGSR